MPGRANAFRERETPLAHKCTTADTVTDQFNDVDTRGFDLRKDEFLGVTAHGSLFVRDRFAAVRHQAVEFERGGDLRKVLPVIARRVNLIDLDHKVLDVLDRDIQRHGRARIEILDIGREKLDVNTVPQRLHHGWAVRHGIPLLSITDSVDQLNFCEQPLQVVVFDVILIGLEVRRILQEMHQVSPDSRLVVPNRLQRHVLCVRGIHIHARVLVFLAVQPLGIDVMHRARHSDIAVKQLPVVQALADVALKLLVENIGLQ